MGAGSVLGDDAPPAHILHPPKVPSPPPQDQAVASNGHAYKESVDWYADLAADVGVPQAPPPPSLPSVAEEEPAQTFTPVPAINIQDEAPVPTQNDPLEDVDMNTSEYKHCTLRYNTDFCTAHKVRTLYPYDGQRDEDLCA
jgi:actin cytoskeleton-regulatory complex protein PAN1